MNTAIVYILFSIASCGGGHITTKLSEHPTQHECNVVAKKVDSSGKSVKCVKSTVVLR